MAEAKETYFASPERTSGETLLSEIAQAVHSPVVNGILSSMGVAAAVLNEHRQILALNDAYLRLLGLDDPQAALGARPGEAVACVHASTAPSGCGTSMACASCGTAIALVTSQRDDAPVEAECALRVRPDGIEDLILAVRAVPLPLAGRKYTLLIMRDISAEKRRAVLESAFLHDLANLAHGLSGASELMSFVAQEQRASLARDIGLLASRLAREVEIQRALVGDRPEAIQVKYEKIAVAQILADLRRVVTHHPSSQGKLLQLDDPGQDAITTDPALLIRSLTNLVINAFEASGPSAVVKVWIVRDEGQIIFCVQNPAVIPPAVRPRIFQRYFSTKPGSGRGQGTFSVRAICEQALGGHVGFSTDLPEGTRFWIRLPHTKGLQA